MELEIHVGDFVTLHSRYKIAGRLGLIIEIQKNEWVAKSSGWVSFDYVILNENGEIKNISSGCVQKVISSNQVP